MAEELFKALWVEQIDGDGFRRSVRSRYIGELPAGDVLVRVQYSSLNYKDALSASGRPGVTKHYPHTPGIDAAGVVVESSDARFKPGDEVLVMGFDLGMDTSGGFGQYIRVPAGWIMARPGELSLRECMAFGTAGLTAAICVEKLIQAGIQPTKGEVLVTGGTGGVGCIAIGILSRLGYDVVASTGKPELRAFLEELGARAIISREEASDSSGRPLLHARWAGAVDTVGGATLATTLRSSMHGGAVAACGNAGGADLNLTVYPFILRGISLLGVDAAQYSLDDRQRIWQHLAGDWKPAAMDTVARSVDLDGLNDEIDRILAGKLHGRVVVDLR